MDVFGSSVILSRVALILACCWIGCGTAKNRPGPDAPNVVLIIIDTLRADRLGSYGFPIATSPALDEIARRGVQFDRALAQSSWTLPSVGSLLTSRYPRSLGLYLEEKHALSDRFETLAEVLRRNGYATLGITANPNMNSTFNFDRGFDVYVDSTVVFRARKEDVPEGNRWWNETPLRTATSVFREAFELIEQSANRFPYYLQLNLMEVHEHIRPNMPMIRRDYSELFKGMPDRSYLLAVRQVTDDVAAFIRDLSASAGWDDTLFVVIGDHGEGLADHPGVAQSYLHGSLLYESQLAVPWIMFNRQWQPRASRLATPVQLLDLLPTVLDYLHIDAPPGLQGRSRLPALEDPSDEAEPPALFVAETSFRGLDKIAVYGADWKYIENREPHPGVSRRELQAVGGGENGDLTNQISEHGEIAREMRKFLRTWEQEHRPAAPTPVKGGLSQSERSQLEAVGYLQ